MVDLVGDQSGNAALKDRDLWLPVDVLVLDRDENAARNLAALVLTQSLDTDGCRSRWSPGVARRPETLGEWT